MFAAYELRYGEDETFETTLTERLVFLSQTTIPSLSVGVAYRVQVRGGTVSMMGDILWGLFAVLRVQDGEPESTTLEP